MYWVHLCLTLCVFPVCMPHQSVCSSMRSALGICVFLVLYDYSWVCFTQTACTGVCAETLCEWAVSASVRGSARASVCMHLCVWGWVSARV